MTQHYSFEPGSRALITFNPHHAEAAGIIGIVTRVGRGAGFMRCDLFHVRYEDPRDGQTHERPFADVNLAAGEPELLLARARWHDEQAALMRRMAEEAGRKGP